MFNKLILALVLAVLAGCATGLSKEAKTVKQADINMVKGCQLLDSVEGSSSVSGLMVSTGIRNARNEAIEEAAKLGATHIVFTDRLGGNVPYVAGDAYKCK